MNTMHFGSVMHTTQLATAAEDESAVEAEDEEDAEVDAGAAGGAESAAAGLGAEFVGVGVFSFRARL
jgi:hypothetical protein